MKLITFFVLVIKGFNQPKATGSKISTEKTKLPDTSLLAGKKLFGDMKSIQSFKQSGLSGVFTGQAVSALSGSVFWKRSRFWAKMSNICAEQDGGPPH